MKIDHLFGAIFFILGTQMFLLDMGNFLPLKMGFFVGTMHALIGWVFVILAE